MLHRIIRILFCNLYNLSLGSLVYSSDFGALIEMFTSDFMVVTVELWCFAWWRHLNLDLIEGLVYTLTTTNSMLFACWESQSKWNLKSWISHQVFCSFLPYALLSRYSLTSTLKTWEGVHSYSRYTIGQRKAST